MDEQGVPVGCMDRYNFINRTATELLESWENGNRDWVWSSLMELPKGPAVAVTALLASRASGFPAYARDRA